MFIKNLKLSWFFIAWSIIFNVVAVSFYTKVKTLAGLTGCGICLSIMLTCIIFSIYYLKIAFKYQGVYDDVEEEDESI